MTYTFMLDETEDNFQYRYGLGSQTAILDDEILEQNPEFKKQLDIFATTLCKQFNLIGVRIHGIEFSTIRAKELK